MRKTSFQAVDIASAEGASAKQMLRECSPQGLSMPQIFIKGQFRAGYAQFLDALENEQLDTLLQVTNEDEELPLH